MVEIKGTLDELYQIFGKEVKREAKRQAKKAGKKVVKGGVRKASAYQKRVGKHMRALNKKAKTKAGKWKKGWNAKRVMKQAHKLAKRG
jgi:hypothetical protein